MSIAKELRESAFKVVESSGFRWKVRRVRSVDLLKVGIAQLRLSDPASIAKVAAGEEPEMDAEAIVRALNSMSEKQLDQSADYTRGVVAAGLTAVSKDGETWEPIQLVLNPAQVDESKNRILVEDLPKQVTEDLYEAIQSIDDGEVAPGRIAAFREGSGPDAPGALDG